MIYLLFFKGLLQGDASECWWLIDEWISRKGKLSDLLRLVALACMCDGGCKQRDLDILKQDIVSVLIVLCLKPYSYIMTHFPIQTYGYEHLLTLQNMEQIGLFFPSSKDW